MNDLLCVGFVLAMLDGDKERLLFWASLISQSIKTGGSGPCIKHLLKCVSNPMLHKTLKEVSSAIEKENWTSAAEEWEKFVVLVLTALKGYGITLLGNNIRCDGNQVTGQRSCPQARSFSSSGLSMLNKQGETLPGIAGVWQLWDYPQWLDEHRMLSQEDRESSGNWVQVARDVVSIVFWKASVDRVSNLEIVGNRVESALIHGIHTIADWRTIAAGMTNRIAARALDNFEPPPSPEPARDNVRFVHNFVRDAACHAIYHYGWRGSRLQSVGDTLYRTNEVFQHSSVEKASLFRSLVTFWPFHNGLASVFIRGLSGFASALNRDDCAVRVVLSDVGSIIGSHVEAGPAYAFCMTALKQLFTDNLYQGQIDVSGEEEPNVKL